MFRNEAQQAQVCETLCRAVGFAGMWTSAGPTRTALSAMKRMPAWSHGEILMFRAAWDVWNGDGKMKFGEALGTLDAKNLRVLGTLMCALGSMHGAAAIDEWLERWKAAA